MLEVESRGGHRRRAFVARAVGACRRASLSRCLAVGGGLVAVAVVGSFAAQYATLHAAEGRGPSPGPPLGLRGALASAALGAALGAAAPDALPRDAQPLAGWLAGPASLQKVSDLEQFRQWLERVPSAQARASVMDSLVAAEDWLPCSSEAQVCRCPSGALRFGVAGAPASDWVHRNLTDGDWLQCIGANFAYDPAPMDLKVCECLAGWHAARCRDGLPVDWRRCPPGSRLDEHASGAQDRRAGEEYCRAGCDRTAELVPLRESPARRRELCGGGAARELLWSCGPGRGGLSRAPAAGAEHAGAQALLDDAVRDLCQSAAAPGLWSQLEVYLDCDFVDNYLRWTTDTSEWLEEAYVTYLGGQRNSLFEWQTTGLIRSVFLFSTRPLVVVLFGDFVVPMPWRSFPNVLVYRMHAGMATVSFNFNKIRAMIGARVIVGIELDTDQVVYEGMDAVFAGTRRECTAGYPFPILPTHWMSREEKKPEVYWEYAFRAWPGTRTMRWGHAHPSWAFWALPFLVEVLFERLVASWADSASPPQLAGVDFAAARSLGVAEAMARAPRTMREVKYKAWMVEDEDMLNVALWRARANKSWCKFDNFPDLSLTGNKLPAKLYGDAKWYPEGLPVVFLSSHATKDFEPTDWLLTLLARCAARPALGAPAPAEQRGECTAGRQAECEALAVGGMRRRWSSLGQPGLCCCLAPRRSKPIFWNSAWHARDEFPSPVLKSHRGLGQCLLP